MFFKKIHFANPGMTEYIFATLYMVGNSQRNCMKPSENSVVMSGLGLKDAA